MLCEKCHQNEATVKLKQIVNGAAKEYNLCVFCAAGGDLGFGLSFDALFQGLVDTFAGGQGFAFEPKKQPEQNTQALKCPSCGLEFQQFRQAGKLGCAECYNSFRENMSRIIKDIQGGNIHEGKIPKRGGGDIVQRREIERLRGLLKKAIDSEEFENAAKLRDRIRALESE